MQRLEILKDKVSALYTAKRPERTAWADWLHDHHVFAVSEEAMRLAVRYGAKPELAAAAGMLHDVADAVMSRFDERHSAESARIARQLLRESGFNEDEIGVIVDDTIALHGCHDGHCPASLEGRVMAAADAAVHLTTDFYGHAVASMTAEEGKTMSEVKAWALPKIERDFHDKIAFDDLRTEVRPAYESFVKYFGEVV